MLTHLNGYLLHVVLDWTFQKRAHAALGVFVCKWLNVARSDHAPLRGIIS